MCERIFLAAPFKQLLTVDNVLQSSSLREIKKIIQFLENKNYIVDNAHKREKWGLKMMTPNQCTAADYSAIEDCNIFIAFPGNPASPGTHIEIGWASAFNKRIILCLRKNVDYAYLIRGLQTIANVEYIYYENMIECLSKIDYIDRERII
ncbi:hypothetical protein GCM10025879_17440 [Leuconostoc litchii]|uniref:Nucleoside 2-deoxyribosyltransferase n=1 Tax=Leuconostoc litchii TaxID=1981069 RepID=A0A6P2CMI9_9LACO|nr:nucleoside 2-deoxyribosyltransferase [Leuconostoc litchii]TYC46633.1 nucleoside 2-deoxyribosyltransferase [Leuconostoc litchii]GMA70498.1 hypothetical protein GCM10025879_17440 [Leuconostoc litchii]